MLSVVESIVLVHIVGLALGVGSATVKITLLLKCRADSTYVPPYLQLVGWFTRLLVLGLILATTSGVVLLWRGYPLTPLMISKLVLVALLWAIGPVIDKVAEPAFRRLAPAPGAAATPEFTRALNRYLAVEMAGGILFYAVVVLGVML